MGELAALRAFVSPCIGQHMNTTRSCNPPPPQAAQAGLSSVLPHLLAAGFPASLADDLGVTPLHLAARGGHVQAVELLLSAGASPSAFDGAPPLLNRPLGLSSF